MGLRPWAPASSSGSHPPAPKFSSGASITAAVAEDGPAISPTLLTLVSLPTYALRRFRRYSSPTNRLLLGRRVDAKSLVHDHIVHCVVILNLMKFCFEKVTEYQVMRELLVVRQSLPRL